ncbi:tubulin epsilon chain-like isoform X2 [Pseudomyrmex gracilis]|uniref:tubulin epsilon chain-like isoform X2 n=1 Tax=Pseudomyrmex gracilis TaxID=219809 RepID=UPI0009951733|nr:tubulin epsilon chain-like isoform X2 [Pseudomyrmex gracilis]
MSEFVTIQVGQCGNQIGSAFWPLALHEYGIQTKTGGVHLLKVQRNHIKHISDLSDAFHSFFQIPDKAKNLHFQNVADLNKSKVKARAVLVDMEDSVVSRFKQGPLRQLFDQTCIVTNYPGSGNNWAIGYHDHGKEYHDRIEESIRRVVERCDRLHGFLLMHSLGGGTGSGLGTAILKLLKDNYPHVERIVSCVYPANMQDTITAPYNTLLATQELIEHATCVFPVENKALLDICNAQLNKRENISQVNYNVSCKAFQDMNSIIVNMLLHLTSGSRFPGSLNMDMNEVAANLVPYPKLHYIFSSISPITLSAPNICTMRETKLQDELFTSAWSRNNQLIKLDPLQSTSVILAAAHIARGNTTLTDMKRNIERFQKKSKFTSWSRDCMKIGLCSVPPAGHSSSLLCLLNSSTMSSLFKDVVQEFSKLYRKKAHVHHYTKVCGFEETHFIESKENIFNLCECYTEVQNMEESNISRLQII